MARVHPISSDVLEVVGSAAFAALSLNAAPDH